MTTKLTEWTWGGKKGFIKKTVLRKDIDRGVKFLSERAYSNISGSTRSSALFCLELKKYIDFSLVYRVDMVNTDRHWYSVRLFTRDGFEILLKGFSFGYWGEGSRGTLAVLRECGFSQEQIQRIFTHGLTKLRMFRRVV